MSFYKVIALPQRRVKGCDEVRILCFTDADKMSTPENCDESRMDNGTSRTTTR